MQLMSSQWLPAMEADTLTVVSYGEVYPPLASPSNSIPLATFRVSGLGTVTINSSNAIRRTLSQCQLIPYPIDPTSDVPVPQLDTDELFPDGNELVLYKGCQYADGTQEVATLGRFLMEDVEIFNQESSGGIYIQLNGSDRGATIDRATFSAPYSTNGTSTLDVQIQAMINQQVSGITYSFSPGPGGFPVPAQANYNVNDGPWTAAVALAASVGFELFFNVNGICVMRPVLNPASVAPCASYVDGESNIVTKVQHSLINTDVPNLVIMVSQGSNVPTPIQSVWWDSNPASPTFYNSAAPPLTAGSAVPPPEGTYPTTTAGSTSSIATTQAANDLAAEAAFLATYGSFDVLDLKLRDNPAHDVDDVITVTSALAGITEANYFIDTITIQLAFAQEMEMKGRLVVGT